MEIELITKEDLRQLRMQLLEDIKQHFSGKTSQKTDWLKSAQVRDMLSISAGTLQTLRVNGTLKHTKIGGSFYYLQSDIDALLKSGKN
ncbi:transcriptional regulator [Dyadobacter frigoris]|uniref:helix-turn-helix domain-containing protein n=1 Tax=Dyadobacter frigoris TaxID=2576211 RepID=UPI0024A08B85|nr:helix-turn-helix domain-containing protein [Dyadobacter frigoris]GLU57375.1 transcriptional regulator [Dyadobacter frigoris]